MTLCSWCDERFDDFVDGQLCKDDQALFLRHVEFCNACKSAVDAHASFIESAQELKNSIDLHHAKSLHITSSKVRKTIRTRQLLVAVQTTAALFFVGVVGWAFYLNRQEAPRMPDLPSSSEKVAGQKLKNLPTADTPKAHVQIEDSEYVAVPVENKNPNITIYWLHPTFGSSHGEPPNDSSSLEQHETFIASNSL